MDSFALMDGGFSGCVIFGGVIDGWSFKIFSIHYLTIYEKGGRV